MERKRSGIPGRKEAEGSASSTPWKYMARTRKVHHYAISGGGEYLCEFSSLVLMTSLVRISESGRNEVQNREENEWNPRKEAVKPGNLFCN